MSETSIIDLAMSIGFEFRRPIAAGLNQFLLR